MEEDLTVDQLIAAITGDDEAARAAAWQNAASAGTGAVEPLAALITAENVETGRAAKRALWVIVRHVGRPGAEAEKRPVVTRLCALLGGSQPTAVQREALWMLSEIGGDEAVAAIREMPDILENTELREDALCAVERIPGDAAIAALQDGLDAAPEDFKPAMAHSLRVRGVEVPGIPCQKLVPTKQTQVKPGG